MCLFSGNVCPQQELHYIYAAEALPLLQLPGIVAGVVLALLCFVLPPISGGYQTAPCQLLFVRQC